MPRNKESFDAMRSATRQKINSAALGLFARHGMSVKIAEIAEAAGVSHGLLYRHYASKEELIRSLISEAANISAGMMLGLLESRKTAAEIIPQVTGVMLDMLRSNSKGIEYFIFMIQCGMNGGMFTGDVYPNGNPNELFAQIVALGQHEGTVVNGDPELLSGTYWAAVQGLCCYAVAGMALVSDEQCLNRILLKEEYL